MSSASGIEAVAESRYEVAAVLIAASVSSGGSVMARSRSASVTDPLAGPSADVQHLYKLCTKSKAVKVIKKFDDVDLSTTTKDKVTDAIEKLFAEKRKSFLLYYSGHGKREDGSWCFEREAESDDAKSEGLIQEFISCEDVIALWNTRPNQKAFHKLVIISDSCFSGHWPLKAKPYKDIFVQPSVGSAEMARESSEGGDFSSAYLDECWRLHETGQRFVCRKGVDLVLGYTTDGSHEIHLAVGGVDDDIISAGFERTSDSALPQLDVCFLVDISTEDTQPYIDAISGCGNGHMRMAFVGYRDDGDTVQFETIPFTEDLDAFGREVSGVRAVGEGHGGDVAKDVFAGMNKCLELRWKADNSKYLAHVCDAPAHGLTFHGGHASDGRPRDRFLMNAEVKKMKEASIRYGLVLTKHSAALSFMAELFKSYLDGHRVEYDAHGALTGSEFKSICKSRFNYQNILALCDRSFLL